MYMYMYMYMPHHGTPAGWSLPPWPLEPVRLAPWPLGREESKDQSPAQVHCCDWAAGVDADKGPAACWLSKYTDDVVFQDYLGRMRARPAYLRAKQIQEASPPLA